MVRNTINQSTYTWTLPNIYSSLPLTRQHMYIMSKPPLTPCAPIRLCRCRAPRVFFNTSTANCTRSRTSHTKSLSHSGLACRLPRTSHHPRPHELRESILPLPEAPERASRPTLQQILLLQEGNARRCRVEAQSQEPPDCGQRHWRLQRLRRRGVER